MWAILLNALVTCFAADDLEARVERFLAAETSMEREAAQRALAGADFDRVFELLRRGRSYSDDVPRGQLVRSRDQGGVVHPYMILVPEDYDASRRWPVRWDLHGGMGAGAWEPEERRWSPNWRHARAQIVVVPAGWWDSMWWEGSQAQNFEAILREVKRTWNVDENRIVLGGSSDGCIGTFFYAFRQPDRWAGFFGHVGSPDRLVRAQMRPDGQMHLSNLAGQRFHLGYGERDPKAPIRHLRKYMRLFEESGALLDWYVVPKAGHDLRLPLEKERALADFLWGTVRDPLPDRLSWATERTDRYNRRSWLVIDELAPPNGSVETTNLLPRWGSSIQMRGPTVKRLPWGRVELKREGNLVTATSTGVARFRLLISPDDFDLAEPVLVDLNGERVFEGVVQPSVATLLAWAGRDEDRTLLFAAEIELSLQ